MSSPPYNEPFEALSPAARDAHRALNSLIEELEAIDYYNQRADTTPNAELREILLHNRNEEIEHAAMVLEWLRRTIPEIDANLKTYLFGAGSIIAAETSATGGEAPAEEAAPKTAAPNPTLGIGKPMRGGM
jgi:ferritin-like protein